MTTASTRQKARTPQAERSRDVAHAAQQKRDRINPIKSLDAARAIQLMESYARGDFADLMWLFAAPFTGLECSDPDYLVIIDRRVGAILEMNWDVRHWKKPHESTDGADSAKEAKARQQAEALYAAYDKIENLYEAFEHLQMALFRGFSILEPTGTELLPVDHWNVKRDGSKGGWFWDAEARPGKTPAECTRLPEERIIVREVKRPIGRVAMLKYIRSHLSESEWDYFVEVYGIPSGIVYAPPNLRPEDKAVFQDAAEKMAQGAPGVLPHGSQYTSNSSARGSQPFRERLEWLEKALIKAGTGGLLTVLSMSGSGTLAGSAHMDAFKILARADARTISETLQAQFDKRVLLGLGLIQPGETPLAWFELAAREEQNTETATRQVVSLSQFFALDPAQVEERTGWKVSEKAQAETLPSTGIPGGIFREGGGGGGEEVADALPVAEAARALQADLRPVAERVAALMETYPNELETVVRLLLDEFPALVELTTIERFAGFLEEHLAQSFAGAIQAEALRSVLSPLEDRPS